MSVAGGGIYTTDSSKFETGSSYLFSSNFDYFGSITASILVNGDGSGVLTTSSAGASTWGIDYGSIYSGYLLPSSIIFLYSSSLALISIAWRIISASSSSTWVFFYSSFYDYSIA